MVNAQKILSRQFLTWGMLLGVGTCSEKTVRRLPRAAGVMLAPERTMRPSSRLLCSSKLQIASAHAWASIFLPQQTGALHDIMTPNTKCCAAEKFCA